MICEQCAWWTMKRRYFKVMKETGCSTVCKDVPTCIHPDNPRGERDGWRPQCPDFLKVE